MLSATRERFSVTNGRGAVGPPRALGERQDSSQVYDELNLGGTGARESICGPVSCQKRETRIAAVIFVPIYGFIPDHGWGRTHGTVPFGDRELSWFCRPCAS